MAKQRRTPSGLRVIPPAHSEERIHQAHVYYGYGKGKTTCCIGLAIRAAGAGRKVALVQFDKGYDGETEHYSERHVLRQIDGVELYPTGCERMMPDGAFRFGAEPKDIDEARRGLETARGLLRKGAQDLLILDEILAAVAYGLFRREDVTGLLDLYDKNRRCELVLSGHKVWDALVERVDLVTEMRKVKHYYARGVPAREGIEF
ncbi:MAG: cob(I)yrinic acid a,c-diamide adenosyltransferase [Gemmatimonadota bacterium]|nr:cob(I)yrinic acid a,c-diamide adenosyltransferase [Gemmatimonadota bacterium]